MKLDLSEPILWVTQGVSNPGGIVVDMTNNRIIWSNEGYSSQPGNTNISSVSFFGNDQRIDFYPQWNEYISDFVQHLAIVEIPAPEPSSLALSAMAGMSAAFFLRALRGQLPHCPVTSRFR
jgi:hypothetical protein